MLHKTEWDPKGHDHATVAEARACVADYEDYAYGDYTGPTCSLCDAAGHGYPGAGPCPLEERGSDEAYAEALYDAARGVRDPWEVAA